MAKTVPPGTITVPSGETFVANAVPDPFDERDLEYRPRLTPLPPRVDQRPEQAADFVLLQKGQSCTGHALAAVINTVLAQTRAAYDSQTDGNGQAQDRPFDKVSPYMLYRLARRYDEFAGEEDVGSSLRGGFKGWFNHGVALTDDWPDLDLNPEPDLDDPAFADRCRDRPLGAFYRINPFRLDDMQSAICELHAIAVSGVIHDGWVTPVELERDGQTMHVISRRVDSKSIGGHAFALVGYNEVGFLVQNSWGSTWGKGGFATLPYEDWLDSAWDAWVARPGVPKTPFASGRRTTAPGTGGTLSTAPGPDLKRLAMHVVNLGNEGKLSTMGKFVSTPAQIDRAFGHMELWHDEWLQPDPNLKRQVVLYAHGGLVSEATGLDTAQKHLNWWLNNRVYPISFAWQSGPAETLIDQLVDSLIGRLPFGGIGFDWVEQFDRRVELFARDKLIWAWDQMKQNARAASDPIPDPFDVSWPPPDSSMQLDAIKRMPGASLTVTRLAEYVKAHGADNVRVHVVGHSAGSIFAAPLLHRLADAGIAVESLAFLAPAIRVDEFERDILPLLGPDKTVARFATFAMTDQRELKDTVGAHGVDIYHKSLLYLVSRSFERSSAGQGGEVPLLGMEKFFDRPIGSGFTLREAIANVGGDCIFSRSTAPDNSRSDSESHGGFDDDSPSMTSVVMRILGVTNAQDVDDYTPNAALNANVTQPPIAAATLPRDRSGSPTAEPARIAAATQAPGDKPVVAVAEPQTQRPVAPLPARGPVVEVAVAPRSGSPVVDLLAVAGWSPVQDGAQPKRASSRRSRSTSAGGRSKGTTRSKRTPKRS